MGTLIDRMMNIRLRTIVATCFMLLLGIIISVPFILMISTSFRSPGDYATNPLQVWPKVLYLTNYEIVFNHKLYFMWYVNSIKVTLSVIGLTLIVVTSAAYAFARLSFPFKNILFLIGIGTMMFPGDVTLMGRYLIYRDMGILNTHWSIILPSIFSAWMFFMIRQFFLGIPKELSESALVDGSSQLKIYYRIILPLAIPGLLTMVLFTFIWVWNDFASPQIFITDEKLQLLSVGLTTFYTDKGPIFTAQIAAALIGIIPPVLLFSFFQRYFIPGIASSGIKG